MMSKYHLHLKKNPESLLAKIVGIYGIRITEKDKVYHVLMENLDPIDEKFVRFKYDLKFSTVNRKEYKNKSDVRIVQNELVNGEKGDPILKEILHMEQLPFKGSLDQLDRKLTGRPQLPKSKYASSTGSESRSKEGKSKKKSSSSEDYKVKGKFLSSQSGSRSNENEKHTSSEEDEDDVDDTGYQANREKYQDNFGYADQREMLDAQKI